MVRPAQRRGCERASSRRTVWWMGLLLLARCATPTTAVAPEAARSHVYPLPLDSVLTQTASVLTKEGWQVQRSGNVLITNWQGGGTGTVITYRVLGQKVDASYSTIRVLRAVATSSTVYYEPRLSGHRPTLGGQEVPLPEEFQGGSAVVGSAGEDRSANSVAAGTAVPFGMSVTQLTRDTALELKLQEQIDPLSSAATQAGVVPAVARLAEMVADAGTFAAAEKQPSSSRPSLELVATGVSLAESTRRLAALGGIWEGTFSFQGTVVGSFSGEVAVAVDGNSAEFSDFCPIHGGTLTASGSGDFAAWQGTLVCPPISLRECKNTIITYDYATAVVSQDTLTVVASGNVDAPAGCINSAGPISVVFSARRADYVHIAVSKSKGKTACVWPTDWEDLDSTGSMAMPEEPTDPLAYLGLIRAKGQRLSEIERLLRHCRQLVLLHGQSVRMRLVATRPTPK
jgi:hypothetical protein